VEAINREQRCYLSGVMDRMSPRSRDGLLEGVREFIDSVVSADEAVVSEICQECGEEHHADCPLEEAHLRSRRNWLEGK
jgi:hypothetical protein